MTQASRTFRVFVSSTFDDFVEERNILQRKVFPELRKLCVEHDCHFQAIDLRWGVRDEVSLDQRAVPICIEEIECCDKTLAIDPRDGSIWNNKGVSLDP